MSYKSRGNYPVKACLKECVNRGKVCDKCWKFSNYIAFEESLALNKPDKRGFARLTDVLAQ